MLRDTLLVVTTVSTNVCVAGTVTLLGVLTTCGFESLVIPFNCATYRTATRWEPGGHALRFHIGLEDLDDLKRDLDAGFARLRETDIQAA
jgi:cystathionine beta-lyase/cystathionine gamma-synthase